LLRLDYLSFALSGLDATGTIAAAVVYTLGDLHRTGAYLDYPVGGSEAVIDALVKGVVEGKCREKNTSDEHVPTSSSSSTSEVRLREPVKEVLFNDGLAVGVRLSSGDVIKARRGVISNAPIWDTLKLVPSALDKTPTGVDVARGESGRTTTSAPSLFPFLDRNPFSSMASFTSWKAGGNNEEGGESDIIRKWRQARAAMPPTDSFTHLHLGIVRTAAQPSWLTFDSFRSRFSKFLIVVLCIVISFAGWRWHTTGPRLPPLGAARLAIRNHGAGEHVHYQHSDAF
jgi:hypothetical protein